MRHHRSVARCISRHLSHGVASGVSSLCQGSLQQFCTVAKGPWTQSPSVQKGRNAI